MMEVKRITIDIATTDKKTLKNEITKVINELRQCDKFKFVECSGISQVYSSDQLIDRTSPFSAGTSSWAQINRVEPLENDDEND